MGELIVEKLSKSFDNVPVLDNVSLRCAQGELLVLLGPSGCGKSTLLRLVAGLEEPDNGEIYLAGRRIDHLSPRERNVALVFQNYSLYPHMSVEKNLAFPLKVARVDRRTIRERVQHVAQLVGMETMLTKKPGQLSGGQRQRVALGRAIIRQPELFLLDEPLSNLDADLRVRMRREIVRLQKKLQVATIHVTHDQAEALTMADRIAVLNEGRLQQVGTPDQLYNHPANLFVAEFIGQPRMNILKGRIERQLLYPFGLSLLNRMVKAPGAEVLIGIRPEAVQLRPDGEYEATAASCEYLGDHYVAALDFQDSRLICSHLRRTLELGQRVRFHVDVSDLHFFDPSGGQNLEPR
jgi:ABC-type sugar transport system ATPase subunit